MLFGRLSCRRRLSRNRDFVYLDRSLDVFEFSRSNRRHQLFELVLHLVVYLPRNVNPARRG